MDDISNATIPSECPRIDTQRRSLADIQNVPTCARDIYTVAEPIDDTSFEP